MFLLLTMHGAKELGLSIKEYYSKAENIAEGQIRLRENSTTIAIIRFYMQRLKQRPLEEK